jgi:hypothetical protein
MYTGYRYWEYKSRGYRHFTMLNNRMSFVTINNGDLVWVVEEKIKLLILYKHSASNPFNQMEAMMCDTHE